MRILLLLALLLMLLSCAQPPKITASLDVQKQGDNVVVVKVKVVNVDSRATVPINVEVTGQAETNGHWDKRQTLLHPAAFVLNRNEQRDITKFWNVPADAVRATMIVKEQERGSLLKTEKAEKVFSGPGAAAGQPSAKSQ